MRIYLTIKAAFSCCPKLIPKNGSFRFAPLAHTLSVNDCLVSEADSSVPIAVIFSATCNIWKVIMSYLPNKISYFLEIIMLVLILIRLSIGRDVELLGIVLNLSLIVIFLITVRLCVPVAIEGEVGSFFGKSISSDSEKEKSLFMGLGFFVFVMVVMYL